MQLGHWANEVNPITWLLICQLLDTKQCLQAQIFPPDTCPLVTAVDIHGQGFGKTLEALELQLDPVWDTCFLGH
jgi:hypothetical protein